MPVRTVELVIHNKSTRELKLYDTHLCWGNWRPTGPPPNVIPAGGQGSIRAESGGPTSGTTGWVKYQFSPGKVIAAQDIPLPPYTISVAWDNPFIAGLFGRATSFGLGLSAAPDIPVDCTHLKPNEVPQGIVAGNDVKYFQFVEGDRTQDAGGDGAYWSEVLASAGLTFYGAGYLGEALAAWGFLEITPHPVLQLTFGEFNNFPQQKTQTVPQFVPMTPLLLEPIAGVDDAFWTESWHAQTQDGKRVRVDLSRQANGKLQCVVDEHVITPDYSHTFNDLDPFIAGADDFAGDQWDPTAVPTMALIQHPVAHGHEVLWPRNGNAAAVAAAKDALARGSVVRLENGPLMKQFRATQRIQLGDVAFLDTYSVYSQGTPVSKRLRYVRYTNRYHPVCDVMLNDMRIY